MGSNAEGNAETRLGRGVWLITGASSGFGFALTEAVLRRGGCVIATSRNPKPLASLARDGGTRLLILPLDVTSDQQTATAVAQAEAHFGAIDVLANVAGYGLIGSIEETSDPELERLFEVNFYGQVRLIKAVLPGMRRRRRGHIVNFSSVAAVSVIGGAGQYAASKLAVEGMSEALRVELQPLGIGVTIVIPGPTRTGYITKGYMEYTVDTIADYAASSGQLRAVLPASHGSQPGDPVRGADVIIDAVDSNAPPARLPLGKMATDSIRAVLQERQRELEKWTSAAIAADYPAPHRPTEAST
jgi:NAD(P)-dependent dehydrogenase (short-subunit alcohol dehydrogenase family)